jgi:uncharacterized protein (DUF433 family)
MNLPDFLSQDADGYIHLSGHRIGLHHVVDRYNEGYSPEMLVFEYDTLSLYLINKVIAFYHENRSEVDAYVESERAEYQRQSANAPKVLDFEELRRRMESGARSDKK